MNDDEIKNNSLSSVGYDDHAYKKFYKNIKCIAPFSSMFLKDFDKELYMTPCCAMNFDEEKIKVDQNISVAENFKKFQFLQQEFISAGHDISKYNRCKDTCLNIFEDSQLLQHNHTAHHNPTVDYISTPSLSTLHVNFSNRCNLACRMCGPDSSNIIARELSDAKEKSANFFIKKYIDPDKEFYKSLFDSLSEIRYIWFSGGEPFLQPEMWEMLNYINNMSIADKVTLQYNTNGTIKLTDSQKNLLNRFHSLQLHVSMDGIGPHAEYIRTGLNWDSWLKNFSDLYNSFKESISVIVTVSALNIHILDEIYNFFKEEYNIIVSFNYLEDPAELCISEMPAAAKRKILDRYRNKKEFYNIIKFMQKKETSSPGRCYVWILEADIKAVSSSIHKDYKLFYDIDRQWLDILKKGMYE